MRAPRQLNDSVVVGTVGGGSEKPYKLAETESNYTYVRQSDQPEADPGQPVSWPLSFHGGIGYSTYDPRTAGAMTNLGILTNVPNVLRAPVYWNPLTLTGAANPPMYYFEADVNDSGADDGKPRLYVIACEAAEINVYKISLAYGYTATGTGVTTDATAKTLTDARAAWTVSEWVGEIVTCNSQTLTVTSNTATVLTGTGGWSADPGDGNAYKIGVGDFETLLNTRTFALTPTQPMGRPAEWYDGTNTQWRLPTGDSTNDLQSLTSIASGAAADTWEPADSGTCDAAARHLRVVGNQLYRTTGTNKVEILARNTDPTTDSNWTGAHYVGNDATKITDIGEATGLCYLAKEDGFYEWDGEGDASNLMPLIGRAPRNGQGMVFWHGGFLIPAASGLWWTKTGTPVGPDSNPHDRGKDTGYGSRTKQGRWMGLAGFGPYIYGLYVPEVSNVGQLLWGRERDDTDPPGWGPIIWHCIGGTTHIADRDDFTGVFIAETSEVAVGETKPTLWATCDDGLAHTWLDRDGAPINQPNLIDVGPTGPLVRSGDFNFGLPHITKQLRVIEGWGEDFKSGQDESFDFRVYRDGGTVEAVGAAITTDGFFQRFWVQDTADTARSMIVECRWVSTGLDVDTDGAHLRDVMVRAALKPNQTILHTFLIEATDNMKTSKKVLSEVEGYINTLKTWERPGGDTFNGFLHDVKLITLPQQGKPSDPPRYALMAVVRQMVGS